MRLFLINAASFLRNRALPVLILVSTVARLISLMSVDTTKMSDRDRFKADQMTNALHTIASAVVQIAEAITTISDIIRGVRRNPPTVTLQSV